MSFNGHADYGCLPGVAVNITWMAVDSLWGCQHIHRQFDSSCCCQYHVDGLLTAYGAVNIYIDSLTAHVAVKITWTVVDS